MTTKYHEQSIRRICTEISAILTATLTAQCYRPLIAILEERYRVKFTEDMLFEINSGLPIRDLAELVSCLVQRNYICLPEPLVEVNQIVYVKTKYWFTKERITKVIPLFTTDPEEFSKYAYYVSGHDYIQHPNIDFFLIKKDVIKHILRGKQWIF